MAASIEGYKNWKPVDFIFVLLTVALFNTSTANSPNINFKTKVGTCSAVKNFPLKAFASVSVSALLPTGCEAAALNTPLILS